MCTEVLIPQFRSAHPPQKGAGKEEVELWVCANLLNSDRASPCGEITGLIITKLPELPHKSLS